MQTKLKSRMVFWTRMLGWLTSGCIVPISIFAIKFGLFKTSGYEVTVDELGNITSVSPTALNGWGIVSCLLVLWTIVQILKEVRDTYTGYSLKKQCVDGILKLMPLITMFAICFFLRGALDEIMYCLTVIIVSRVCSIPLNPLPKWKYETKGVENYEDGLTTIVKYIKNKTKGGGE